MRARTAVAGAIVAGTIAFMALAGSVPSGDASAFRAWLGELRTDPDRGWDRLEESIRRTEYGNDIDRYLADVDAADWDALQVERPAVTWSDDGFVALHARLISEPSTVPRFLFDRGIVAGWCVDGHPVGIGAYEQDGLFTRHEFGGGGTTGSQLQCNRSFHPDP